MLGRVGRQHDRHPAASGRDVPQPPERDRRPGHPRGALGVGDVARQAVRAGLLERERHADQPSVELRDRHLGRRVQRAQPGIGVGPLGSGRGQAQRLDHRDIQGGDRPDVPGLVVAACLGLRGHRAARREHGHDQDVRRAQCGQQVGAGGPQAGAPDRQGTGAAGPDRRAQGVHERRVARQLVRPVVEHRHDRLVLCYWLARRHRLARPGRLAVLAGSPGGHGRRPQAGIGSGAAKPLPPIRTVSARKFASSRRFPWPP